MKIDCLYVFFYFNKLFLCLCNILDLSVFVVLFVLSFKEIVVFLSILCYLKRK